MGDGGGSDASRNWSIGEWAIYKTMLPFAADFPFCSLATPLQLRTTNNQQPTTPSITECPCGLIGLSLSPGHNRSKSGHLIPFLLLPLLPAPPCNSSLFSHHIPLPRSVTAGRLLSVSVSKWRTL